MTIEAAVLQAFMEAVRERQIMSGMTYGEAVCSFIKTMIPQEERSEAIRKVLGNYCLECGGCDLEMADHVFRRCRDCGNIFGKLGMEQRENWQV